MSPHWGRSFGRGRWIEDKCPCPQEACGLVAVDRMREDCPEHRLEAAKTIRQMHDAQDCPGKRPE